MCLYLNCLHLISNQAAVAGRTPFYQEETQDGLIWWDSPPDENK